MSRRSGRLPPDDRGAATAELAIVLPAVVLLLALGVGVLSACGTRIRLQDAAADAARLVARGDPSRAADAVAAAVPRARLDVEPRGDLVCVTAGVSVRIVGAPVRVSATSCALSGGR